MLFGLAFATWGVGTQGVQPTVTGLGKVSVRGLTADDVAFLQAHTGRPGLVSLVLGIVIAISAVLSWWRTELHRVASAVAAIVALATAIWAMLTVWSLESKLFDAAVNDALGGGSSVLRPGWGLIGTIVVAGVCAVVGVSAATYLTGEAKV